MAPARKKQRLDRAGTATTNGNVDETITTATESPEISNEKAVQQRRSLFVRSLPPDTTSESLTELFSESYPIKHATAVTDAATKQCRGYGFVTFADAEDAQKAQAEFNGHQLGGRRLRIALAEPRHRDNEKTHSADIDQRKEAKKQQDAPQPSRLIVRNLPWTVKTSDQLSKLFLSYGKIKHAYIPKGDNGRMAGFGFVVLRGRKNAEKALEGINGKEIDGRTLAVDWAVSKDVYDNSLNTDVGEQSEQDGAIQNGEMDDEQEAVDDEDVPDHDGALEEGGNGVDLDSEDEDDELEDGDDVDVQLEDDEEGDDNDRSDDRSTTLFVRNLTFACTDEDLEDHFAAFGKTRYARVVMDSMTGRSKGTGFVCFYNKSDADACVRNAPRRLQQPASADSKDVKTNQNPNSILQNENLDPNGQYTMDGRVLQISRAVDKSEANRLTEEGVAHRHKRNEDKRRLYLLQEGTISSKSKLWESLSVTEQNMRDASAKQRKKLIESNPSLHLSLTRLSIRNIPRSVDSTKLKALAREAVVGFATDVKSDIRQKLSKEELARGGEEMQDAEKARKRSGKGIVKQAKVVFEGASGSKTSEDSGAGRSRGYGFIEYYTHRSALMGLRWLNGHAIGYQVRDQQPKVKGRGKASVEELQDRKKRLIVEFAIENAQVVVRRKDREVKARERSIAGNQGTVPEDQVDEAVGAKDVRGNRKRKRGADTSTKLNARAPRKDSKFGAKPQSQASARSQKLAKKPIDEKLAKRNQIIGRKRAMRRARKDGK